MTNLTNACIMKWESSAYSSPSSAGQIVLYMYNKMRKVEHSYSSPISELAFCGQIQGETLVAWLYNKVRKVELPTAVPAS